MRWDQILQNALRGTESQSALHSPAVEWLGGPNLTAYDREWVTAEWSVEPRALNSRGVLFGGYYSVLADSMAALATMTVLEDDEHFVTSDLRVSYFKPISEGRILMRADLVNRTRNLAHVDVAFSNEAGELLAKASAVNSLRRQ